MAKQTQEQRDRAKYEALKKELQALAPRLKEHDRKRREGQIFAFGRYFEARYKTLTPSEREAMKKSVSSLLTGEDLKRALEGLERLDNEKATSPSKAAPEAQNNGSTGSM